MVVQQVQPLHRRTGRAVGLDLHRDFCEVVICEEGVVRSAGTGIAQARTKSDRLDARTLASLLWKGGLEAVWMPDERARVVRRRLARREGLLRTRNRVKNEVDAVLMRRLKGKPPCSDLFGVKGRRWLRRLSLPPEEAETVGAALRQIAFLDREVERVERMVAEQMLTWPEAQRLMTVPGVNLIAAATFLSAVGDIARFRNPRKLVAYLGLDPRLRQSGEQPASPPEARAPSRGWPTAWRTPIVRVRERVGQDPPSDVEDLVGVAFPGGDDPERHRWAAGCGSSTHDPLVDEPVAALNREGPQQGIATVLDAVVEPLSGSQRRRA
jgi:hypothetical protein